jgi:hypothetical protein
MNLLARTDKRGVSLCFTVTVTAGNVIVDNRQIFKGVDMKITSRRVNLFLLSIINRMNRALVGTDKVTTSITVTESFIALPSLKK